MTFAPDDAAAMLSDFGTVLEHDGRRIACLVDFSMVSTDDGSGFPVQRKVQMVRTMKGALGPWQRGDAVLIGGVRYYLREAMDDPRTLDEAFDFISIGRSR